jgi:ribonuclease Z
MTKAFIQVLGTDNGDASPSILVFFDNHRYLFNVGEGAQRFCLEHKVRIAKVNHLFVTGSHWNNLGGLPGT